MQILSIELENVKSYKEAKVDFTLGVNAIVGHNGAGKSTILEAIGFALFDTLDYNQADFVRGGANYARVIVTFQSSTDERAYQVIRRVGSSSQYKILDPEMETEICDGKADVMRFLRTHLNVEPGTDLNALFRDAVGVPQGTLTAAFLLTGTARKKVFDALLQVEEYQRVSDRLREPAGVLRDRKSELELKMTALRTRLERLPELREAVKAQKQELEATQQEQQKSVQALEMIQAQRQKQDEARNQVVAAERALAEGKQRLATLESQLKTAQERVTEAEEAAGILAANLQGFEQYQVAQGEQEEMDKQVRARRDIEAKRVEADRKLAQLQETVRGLKTEAERASKAAELAETLKPDVAKQEKLERKQAEAKAQSARLDDAKKRLRQSADRVATLNSQLIKLDQQLAKAETLRDAQRALQQENEALGDAVRDARDRLTSLKSQAEIIKEQTDQLETLTTATCPVCEQPLTPEHREEMLARNQRELAALREKWREANLTVTSSEKTLDEKQAQSKQLQQQLLQLPRAEEREQTEVQLAEGKKAQEEAENQVKQLAGIADEMQSLEQQLADLGDPRRRYNAALDEAGRREEIQKRLVGAREQMESTAQTVEALAREVADFGNLDSRLDEINRTLQTYRAAYQAYLGSQREAGELAGRQHRVQGLAEEVETLGNTVSRLEKRHEEAKQAFDEDAYAAVVEQESTLQEKLGGLRASSKLLEENIARSEVEVKTLSSLTTEMAEAEANLARLTTTAETLDLIRRLLRQAGPYITETLVRQISEGARQIFSELMDDYSRHLAWNTDYSITLEVDGHQRSFSQLSGGEQMSAALSVRLALLREMSSIDVAFFDEPTANLDLVRREQLASQILKVKGFRQIFVISHDDTFEQATQNLIRVERQGDGSSRVSYG